MHRFCNRYQAGEQLAAELRSYITEARVVVVALPRGGVPVGYEVARALGAPLDVLVVRKLGVPGQEELAMGAIATGGVQVINTEVTEAIGISEDEIAAVAARERAELERRELLYRGNRPAHNLHDRTVVLVDDGLATGTSMRAALIAVRQQQPARIVVAVPVIARESIPYFRQIADTLVWVLAPKDFVAVGLWYADFSPTGDREVCELLAQAAREKREPAEPNSK